MPPQSEQGNPCEGDGVTNDDNKVKDSTAEGSYWDAPKETTLQGKTISTLDMTTMESNHPEVQQKKKDDYWEATPEKSLAGKTLSTLDISLLGSPGQSDNTTALPSSHSRSSSTKSVITAEETDLEPSYWDAPKETSLQGKTLSTLDMTALETNHPEQQQRKQDDYWGESPKVDSSIEGKTLSTLDITAMESNHPDEKQEKGDSYWGSAQKDSSLEGKTLSTLSMSALESNHPDEKKEKHDNYWEAPVEDKLKGKRLSTIDMKTLEDTAGPTKSITATEEPTEEASYWDDAPIDKSLQGKRLSSIELAALEKQRVDEPPKPAHPYWDWQGPVTTLKKTLSKISLSNLRKGSKNDAIVLDDDCVHGGSNNASASLTKPPPSSSSSGSLSSSSSSSGSVKPITKKVHRLRDSWRKSFQRLSTTTLDQLDESTGSGSRVLGKRIFKSRNSLDVSGGSQMSIGEDAIMF